MRKLFLLSVCVLGLIVVAASAEATTFSSGCGGSGSLLVIKGGVTYAFPQSFSLQATSEFTSPTGGVYDSGILTVNTVGVVCRYTLSSGTFTFDPATLTGTDTVSWTNAPEKAGCTPKFTAHDFFVSEASGSESDDTATDPNRTGQSHCILQ